MMATFAKMTWVEMKLFAREPLSLVFAFAFPLIVLVVLIASFPNPEDALAFGGVDPSAYYLAGYIAVVISTIGLVTLPVRVASYRERGILRRFRASSVPLWSVATAQVAVGIVMAAAGAVVLTVAGTAIYDAGLPESTGPVLAMFVLGTLAFVALGLLIGSVTRTARGAQALGMILFFPMWLLSGAGPPPDILGEGMRKVMDVLPLTHVVRAIQDPWIGLTPRALDVAVLLGILIVAGSLSIRRLRLA
jgi:ABC-2 type transport system permease protein